MDWERDTKYYQNLKQVFAEKIVISVIIDGNCWARECYDR